MNSLILMIGLFSLPSANAAPIWPCHPDTNLACPVPRNHSFIREKCPPKKMPCVTPPHTPYGNGSQKTKCQPAEVFPGC